VVFLHRLERGRASKSYGIEVARLAGLPPAALARAREVLARLERYELDVFAEDTGEVKAERALAAGAADSSGGDNGLSRAGARAARRRVAAQTSLFDLANQKVVDELRSAKPDTLSADEAKQLLTELRKQLM
jgi:DNA mismatch repair protein MutS